MAISSKRRWCVGTIVRDDVEDNDDSNVDNDDSIIVDNDADDDYVYDDCRDDDDLDDDDNDADDIVDENFSNFHQFFISSSSFTSRQVFYVDRNSSCPRVPVDTQQTHQNATVWHNLSVFFHWEVYVNNIV